MKQSTIERAWMNSLNPLVRLRSQNSERYHISDKFERWGTKLKFLRLADEKPFQPPKSGWTPQFLCKSLTSPIVLSDGRVTTCTMDSQGRNEVANIFDHSFEEMLSRYWDNRFSAMEKPTRKPGCYECFTRHSSWQNRWVPRVNWMNRRFGAAEVDGFKSAMDPQHIKMNIEISAKCNLRCSGCSVSKPNFVDTRGSMNIDMDHLKEWIEPGLSHVDQIRLYHMGETWNHPRWAEFCRHVKGLKPELSLFTSTNGNPLNTPAKLDDVVDVGFDHVMFSIHGATQESCARYMGDNFNFGHALEVVKGLSERKRAAKSIKPYLSWKYLLFSWNDSDEEIATAKRLCDEVGFDEINFTITSQPSPSPRFAGNTDAWRELQAECAELWPRAASYQKAAPMSAIYPGERNRNFAAQKKQHQTGQPVPKTRQSHIRPVVSAAKLSSSPKPKQEPVEDLVKTGQMSEVLERLTGNYQRKLTIQETQWLGDAYYHHGRFGDALEAYKNVLKESKGSEFQHLAHARTLAQLKRYSEAEDAFEQAISMRELAGRRSYGEDIYLELRAVLLAQNKSAEAETMWRLWVENSYLRESKSRVVYAPIPKNACTYLKTALVRNSLKSEEFANSPLDAHQFHRQNGATYSLGNKSVMSSRRQFSFVVLRNPFERLLSAYANVIVRPYRWRPIPDAPAHPLVYQSQSSRKEQLDLRKGISFSDFIKSVVNMPDHLLDYHFRPQTCFYESLEQFSMVADFDDLAPLKAALEKKKWNFSGIEDRNETRYLTDIDERCDQKLPAELVKMDGIPTPSAMYDKTLRDLVRRRFKSDFDAFESRFGKVDDPVNQLQKRQTKSNTAQKKVHSLQIYPTGGALAMEAPEDTSAPAVPSDPTSTPISSAKATHTGKAERETPQTSRSPHGIILRAGPDNLQGVLNEISTHQSAGKTVRLLLAAGIYRGQFVLKGASYSKVSLEILAEQPGTVHFTGCDEHKQWHESEGLWVASWPHSWGLSSAPPDYGDPYLVTPELMRRREMAFLNGQLARQVTSADELSPGTFLIDEDSGQILIKPFNGLVLAETRIDIATRSKLFHIQNVCHLSVSGITFRGDASGFHMPQSAALQLTDCKDVLIEHCSFSDNNNKGLQIDGQKSERVVLRNLNFHHNGCLGLLASRVSDLRLENIEFSENNWRGNWSGFYRGSPAAAKIMKSHNVTVTGCRSVRNHCTGLWFDELNTNVAVSDCLFAGNYRGLHIEATPGPVSISNCTIIDNRTEPTPNEWRWKFGSGLAVTHARNVTVTGCILSGNDVAQIGIRDDRETRRLKDSLTGQESEEFTANLKLENNTIIANSKGALLRIPDETFDGGRFWNTFETIANRYFGSPNGSDVQISSYHQTIKYLSKAAWEQMASDRRGK